jgi:hypothetical protein
MVQKSHTTCSGALPSCMAAALLLISGAPYTRHHNNMLNARTKRKVHPPQEKIGGAGNFCAYIAAATTARRLGMLNLRHRHWCHIQPNMRRTQPTLFSIPQLAVAVGSLDGHKKALLPEDSRLVEMARPCSASAGQSLPSNGTMG